MPALTADFYSVQQTIANALEDGTATAQIPPGVWGAGGRYCASYDMSSGTVAKSKTLGMVTIPAGVIVLAIGLITSATLSTSTISIGSSASTAKYKAAGTFTTTNTWTWFNLATAFATQLVTPLSAAELIVIAETGTADLPSSGTLGMIVQVARPQGS